MFLEENATSLLIKSKDTSWILKVMKKYSWNTLQTVGHIDCSIIGRGP